MKVSDLPVYALPLWNYGDLMHYISGIMHCHCKNYSDLMYSLRLKNYGDLMYYLSGIVAFMGSISFLHRRFYAPKYCNFIVFYFIFDVPHVSLIFILLAVFSWCCIALFISHNVLVLGLSFHAEKIDSSLV